MNHELVPPSLKLSNGKHFTFVNVEGDTDTINKLPVNPHETFAFLYDHFVTTSHYLFPTEVLPGLDEILESNKKDWHVFGNFGVLLCGGFGLSFKTEPEHLRGNDHGRLSLSFPSWDFGLSIAIYSPNNEYSGLIWGKLKHGTEEERRHIEGILFEAFANAIRFFEAGVLQHDEAIQEKYTTRTPNGQIVLTDVPVYIKVKDPDITAQQVLGFLTEGAEFEETNSEQNHIDDEISKTIVSGIKGIIHYDKTALE